MPPAQVQDTSPLPAGPADQSPDISFSLVRTRLESKPLEGVLTPHGKISSNDLTSVASMMVSVPPYWGPCVVVAVGFVVTEVVVICVVVCVVGCAVVPLISVDVDGLSVTDCPHDVRARTITIKQLKINQTNFFIITYLLFKLGIYKYNSDPTFV